MQKPLFYVIVKLQDTQGHNIDSNLNHIYIVQYFPNLLNIFCHF